jgi:hypothetical protein
LARNPIGSSSSNLNARQISEKKMELKTQFTLKIRGTFNTFTRSGKCVLMFPGNGEGKTE